MGVKAMEYKVLPLKGDTVKDQSALNALGLIGWELVAVILRTPDEVPVAYFKKEK